MSKPLGTIRDSIVDFLASMGGEASATEIGDAVAARVSTASSASVRSYLSLNVPTIFERTSRGRYRLRDRDTASREALPSSKATFMHGKAAMHNADCFEWLAACEPASIHAVICDPPYGLVEYTGMEQAKLRNGRGGVWRIPPAFDGHKRSPLPRFTVLDEEDRRNLHSFFGRLGRLLTRVLVPGANVVVASNPLLAHIVTSGMSEAGLEVRGTIVRLTMTMRGGDRPKNAHREFGDVSVMPRSMWEPWVVLRRPLDGRVQDNLRRWGTGGFRRLSADKPFGDVIRSSPTPSSERRIAPHPSLKPQDFLRRAVRGVLPLGTGIVLDPFAGSGSTLAAANAVGYDSIGIEADPQYFAMARSAIPKLELIPVQIDPV